MKFRPVIFYPIGILRSNFRVRGQSFNEDRNAFIDIKKEFVKGLRELNGFSHIIVVFYFNRSKEFMLEIKPLKYNPLGKVCGVFATRSPFRPNPIGISVVKLIKIEENKIYIVNRDILNGTPILDIKPYLPEEIESSTFGWYDPNNK